MITPFLFITIMSALFALAACLFFIPQRRNEAQKDTQDKNTLEMPCPSCQQILFITRTALRPLASSEIALLVREMPDLEHKDLGEIRCDYCHSGLTFRRDTQAPVFMISDLSEPVQHKHTCTECHKALERPTWPEGAYSDISQIPAIPEDLGLECPHCASITCISCLETNTRKRTQDDTLLCPRCFRGPVNIVHYF